VAPAAGSFFPGARCSWAEQQRHALLRLEEAGVETVAAPSSELLDEESVATGGLAPIARAAIA
jgi:hypothetical protein